MANKNEPLKSTEPKALIIDGVVVPKGTLCECWDENWAYAENGLDTYCTKCNLKD